MRSFGAAVGALILAIWSIAPALADERVLRLIAPSEVETLDPHLRTWAAERIVTTMMLDGLTREDVNGDPAPAGAKSWDISADGRQYTFHLRPDVRFSDGRPVTADDFVYAFRRHVDPKTGSQSTSAVESIQHARDCLSGKLPPDALGVTAVDDQTLVVMLSHPSPFFLNWATLLIPLEHEDIARWGAGWTEPGHMASNGPFVLAAFHRGGTIELVRNPTYWNAANIRLDRIKLIVAPGHSAARQMFAAGEIDAINLTDDEVKAERATLGDQMKMQPLNRIAYYFFNMTTGPLAEQQGLRRALALSFETEAVARKLAMQTGEPANSLIPRSFPAYAHPRLDFASHPMADRLAEARRLYGEAHYGPQRPLTVNLVEGSSKRCQVVADLWRANLGPDIHCTIIEDDAARLAAYRRGEFDMGLMVENAAAPDPLELLESFQSSSPNPGNAGHYQNATFDDLLRQADGSADFLSRAEKLARAERMLLDDLPAIPIAYGRIAYIVSPRIKGFRVLPSRSLFVDGVTIETP
ncbi:MAG TPA: peptide ABC transporter substrate-binding protein [Aliidongia sp.]|uniref:peptide ABC transporter substrate-binding protein n=1 Tax=Aliidongia sp. TaxID=1914230 RepID=UPI002DDD7779|nr:peptide ABC transporter substrate-binding protein [Aliidongia sp.]HEV2675964.1 peptide ABC transporter substrate-binding protein [Aliidongia sp.]